MILGNLGQKLSWGCAHSFNSIQLNTESDVSHIVSKAPIWLETPARFPCFDKQNDIYLNSSEKHLSLLYTQESSWRPSFRQWNATLPGRVLSMILISSLRCRPGHNPKYSSLRRRKSFKPRIDASKCLTSGNWLALIFLKKWFVICCPRNWVFSKEVVHFTTRQPMFLSQIPLDRNSNRMAETNQTEKWANPLDVIMLCWHLSYTGSLGPCTQLFR